MKTLGNIIWIVFGGLHIALEYFSASAQNHRHGHGLVSPCPLPPCH